MKRTLLTDGWFYDLSKGLRRTMFEIFPYASDISFCWQTIEGDNDLIQFDRIEKSFFPLKEVHNLIIEDKGDYSICRLNDNIFVYLKEKKMMITDSNFINYKKENKNKILGLVYNNNPIVGIDYGKKLPQFNNDSYVILHPYRKSRNIRLEAFVPSRYAKFIEIQILSSIGQQCSIYKYMDNITIIDNGDNLLAGVDDIRRILNDSTLYVDIVEKIVKEKVKNYEE